MPEKELTHDATDSYSIRNPPSGAPDPQVVDSIREAAATSFLAVAGTDRLRVTAWAALADLAARTAARLSTRAARSAACEARYPIDVIDELTIDQRIAIGDREALYDAIREAQGRLDDIANRIDLVLTDGRHLAACHAVRQSKQEARRTDSPRNGVAAEPPCLTEE